MGKTIAVKHHLSLYGLINYINKHNIRGVKFKSNEGHEILVSFDGEIDFIGCNFNDGETYEVDVYHEVGLECKYGMLVEILVYKSTPNVYRDTSINKILDDDGDTKEIHAYINGQFYKIFDVFEDWVL